MYIFSHGYVSISLESHGEDSEQVISYNAQMAISPLGKCEAL